MIHYKIIKQEYSEADYLVDEFETSMVIHAGEVVERCTEGKHYRCRVLDKAYVIKDGHVVAINLYV